MIFALLLLLALGDPQWCAEATRSIPVQALTGQVAGEPFGLDSARFHGETLILQGEDTQIRIWAPWTAVPAGLTFTADSTSRLWEAPVVEVVRGDTLQTYNPTHGYGLRLEFASPVDGQLPTRINLRLPDGSWLAGEFSVSVSQ